MIYRYDRKNLLYKRDRKLLYLLVGGIAVAGFVGHFIGINKSFEDLTEYEKSVVLINMKQKPFSEADLICMMQELNMKFPYIALAQARVETGHFTSNVFKKNHNLFGMKQARQRVNTAKGTQHNHAYYDTWEESVYDYAFYQCRYLSGISTEEEYFKYIAGSYAEDPHYVSKLKKMIKDENLQAYFK